MIPYLKYYDTDCHLFAINKTNQNASFGIGQHGNAIYGL